MFLKGFFNKGLLSRSERNRKGRREQPVGFLNARVENSKLFKKKEEKESINYAFTREFKLDCKRSMRFAASNRLLDSITNFRLYIYVFIYIRVTLFSFNPNITI